MKLPDKPRRLVFLHWVDPDQGAGWTKRSKAATRKPGDCFTVGWLLHEDESTLVLSSTCSENEVNGVMTMPRCLVKSMKQLPLPAMLK